MVPIFSVETLRAAVDRELVTSRFVAVLMGLFGAVSLFLAALGIYGVLSQSVSARRREVGLRSALGAGSADTVRLFVRHGATLTALGLALGLLSSLAVTRFVESLLFGVSPIDPLTLVATSGLLVVSLWWPPTSRLSGHCA